MRKFFAFILCLLIVMPAAAGCADASDGDETTAPVDTSAPSQSDTGESSETTALEDCFGFVPIDFGDKTVNFLYWSDVQNHEFEVEEITGDLIDDAIYNRNVAIEERLGVNLGWIGIPGNYDNQASFVNTAYNDIAAGGTEYDIFAGYSMTAATLAMRGCSQNLLELDYLNFEQPWWPDSLISQSTISDKLFFCSGDISANVLYMMYCIYFNKDLLANYNLESPYELVYNNGWTVDKLIEMSTGLYTDLNSNNVADDGDFFGLITCSIFFDSFFWGSGLTTVEKNAAGELEVSDKWNSEKTLTLLEKLTAFFHTNGSALAPSSTAALRDTFKAGNALFTLTEAQYSLKHFSESEVSYGVVPVPKYDSAQENFITILSYPHTMYSISSATSKATEAAAVLECDGFESYSKVTPAIFETSFKYKYSSGSDDVVMWDLVRENISFDLGRIFTSSMGNYTYSLFRHAVRDNTASSWASQFKTYKKILDKYVENIQQTIDDLE